MQVYCHSHVPKSGPGHLDQTSVGIRQALNAPKSNKPVNEQIRGGSRDIERKPIYFISHLMPNIFTNCFTRIFGPKNNNHTLFHLFRLNCEHFEHLSPRPIFPTTIKNSQKNHYFREIDRDAHIKLSRLQKKKKNRYIDSAWK